MSIDTTPRTATANLQCYRMEEPEGTAGLPADYMAGHPWPLYVTGCTYTPSVGSAMTVLFFPRPEGGDTVSTRRGGHFVDEGLAEFSGLDRDKVLHWVPSGRVQPELLSNFDWAHGTSLVDPAHDIRLTEARLSVPNVPATEPVDATAVAVLEARVAELEADLTLMTSALREEAVSREWCGEYGDFVNEVNPRMSTPWLQHCPVEREYVMTIETVIRRRVYVSMQTVGEADPDHDQTLERGVERIGEGYGEELEVTHTIADGPRRY